MALINTSLPNLVQGVSQQPATLRFDGQCAEQINALSSVADGLKKRPNTRYLRNLINDKELDDGAFVHFINRDDNEKYVLVIDNTLTPNTTTVRVYDIINPPTSSDSIINWNGQGNGSSTFNNSNDYLFIPSGTKPKDVLKALTVGDTTFILNTSKTINRKGGTSKSPAITSSPTTNKALVFVKKGDYSTEYNIKIKARFYTSGTLTSGAVLSGGTIETDTGENNTGQIEYNLDSGSPVDGDRFVDNGTEQLSSSTYEFNASFKTPQQTAGETNQAISASYIAKSLRDAINSALQGKFVVNSFGGSFLALNPTRLTVGEIDIVDKARAPIGNETNADLTNQEKRGNVLGDSARGGDFTSKAVIDPSGDLTSIGEIGAKSFQQYVFEISSSDNVEFEISAFDSKSGSALGVVYKEVDSISDLPKIAPNDFKVKVRGNVEDNEDDFYVKFETDSGTSEISNGGWVEDVGFDEFIELDNTTLPYTMVNTLPNTFDLVAATWNKKQVGDLNTNPFPSFFSGTNTTGDRKISSLFFFKNRLGFLSEGSVIMSEVGEYFNFFRTTVRSLLDSDPIDVNVASKRVTKLSSAVGFQENLILFAKRGQFVLRGGELLTPKTVSITPITNYESDTSTTPLELGSYLYFPFTRGSFSGMREFTVNASTDNYDSAEITAHVPQYIPSNILDMAGSTAENLICLVSNKTSDETRNMYVYKYYWEGNEKILSSWSKFVFPFKIRGMEFIDSDLFLVVSKNGKTELLKMPMEEKLVDEDTDFNTYLDMRIAETVNVNTGQITLPFTPESNDVIQVYTREAGNTKAGAILPSTLNGNVLSIPNQILTHVWVGIKYEMSYTFSEQLFKQRANRNKSPSGYQRHFLKGGTLFFDDSSSFRVEVTPKARKTYKNIFSSTIIGASTIGTLPIESGSFAFPIMSSAKDTEIKIINDSALPANFQSAEFESFIHSRSRRV